jgi:hypothetical protein
MAKLFPRADLKDYNPIKYIAREPLICCEDTDFFPDGTSSTLVRANNIGRNSWAPAIALSCMEGIRGVVSLDLSIIDNAPQAQPQLEFLMVLGRNSTGNYEANGVWTPTSTDKLGNLVNATNESQGLLVWMTGVPFLWCSVWMRFLNVPDAIANFTTCSVNFTITMGPQIPGGRNRWYGSCVTSGALP